MFDNNHATLAKNIVSEILYKLPPKIAHNILYFYYHREWPNLKNPVYYDEKIHYYMINKYNSNYGKYVDKYLVRDYVKQCGLGNLLIPLYGVYNTPEEIDYDKLPNEFILMATHGSGESFYIICTNKSELNVSMVNKKMQHALNIHFEKMLCEYQYAGCSPRIICEMLLKEPERERLTDYKVSCVNGRPTRILVCSNRNKGRDYYSPEWEYLDHVKPEYRSGRVEERPKNLDEMLKAAEVLSTPFPLSRIDFYSVGGKLYFGEITLTPCAGNHSNLSRKGQIEWG